LIPEGLMPCTSSPRDWSWITSPSTSNEVGEHYGAWANVTTRNGIVLTENLTGEIIKRARPAAAEDAKIPSEEALGRYRRSLLLNNGPKLGFLSSEIPSYIPLSISLIFSPFRVTAMPTNSLAFNPGKAYLNWLLLPEIERLWKYSAGMQIVMKIRK